ncbi:KAP family P-loop domain protein [compost metagenome]
MKLNHLPLTDEKQDILDFNSKAKEIADYINSFPHDIPGAISIIGEWGTGKSTLMNFVENEIDPKRCSLIRFNPWIFSDRNQILHSLFEEIYDCIDNGFTNAKDKFLEYAQKLSKPVTKIATYIGQTAHGVPHQLAVATSEATAEVLGQVTKSIFEKPISKRRKEVENELEIMVTGNQKKIVIFIDEIDRMFPDEVIQIFQAIKSVLDLPGLLFVVAMDNDAINDSLKKTGISRPMDYLQKIFQHNFHLASKYQLKTLFSKVLLPQFEGATYFDDLLYLFDTFVKLKNENFRKLSAKENDDDEKTKNFGAHETIESSLIDSYHNINKALRQYFENPRKFIKLTNYFKLNWESIYIKSKDIISLDKHKLVLQATFVLFVAKFELGSEIDISFYPSKVRYFEETVYIKRCIYHFLDMLTRSDGTGPNLDDIKLILINLSNYPDLFYND